MENHLITVGRAMPLTQHSPNGDFYATVDLGRARRLGSAIFGFAFLCSGLLLTLSPPTAEIGGAGWVIAGVIALAALGSASVLKRLPVSPGHMLVMSYGALAGIAVLEWLAGGDNSPYNQLYTLPVLFTAFVHPPRRVIAFFVAYAGTVGWAFYLRGGLGSPEASEVAMQALIATGMGVVGTILISGLRAQRIALRNAESEERRRAETDPLTGLGNRRRLMADLEETLHGPEGPREAMLVVLDLDGFKAYNDMFGHPAGDELLARLGHNLSAVIGAGAAYRMGGDEFCVLSPLNFEMERALVRRAVKALSERGEGFEISASYGVVMIPSEATISSDALRVADRRMYARKASQQTSPGRQSAAALMELLSQRNPDLRPHSANVAALCEAVGRRMNLPVDELVPLLDAAPLHDIGKAAIPDAILDKAGALEEQELSFIRRHTVIGERILRAAPALAGAAMLVRSSHERMDGKGYPDGLRGTEIPLGSRIIAACDAYDAMVSERPYGVALSREEAITELRRMAGSQFDPEIVDVLVEVLNGPAAQAKPERHLTAL